MNYDTMVHTIYCEPTLTGHRQRFSQVFHALRDLMEEMKCPFVYDYTDQIVSTFTLGIFSAARAWSGNPQQKLWMRQYVRAMVELLLSHELPKEALSKDMDILVSWLGSFDTIRSLFGMEDKPKKKVGLRLIYEDVEAFVDEMPTFETAHSFLYDAINCNNHDEYMMSMAIAFYAFLRMVPMENRALMVKTYLLQIYEFERMNLKRVSFYDTPNECSFYISF